MPDGSCVFTKPLQLQQKFEMYMPDGPIMSIPRDPMSQTFCKSLDIEDSPTCDTTKFRALHGKLIQLIDYRPDIAFAVSKLSQRQCTLRVKDMEAQIFLFITAWHKRQRDCIAKSKPSVCLNASPATWVYRHQFCMSFQRKESILHLF